MLKAVPTDIPPTAELDEAKAPEKQPDGADKPWFVYPLLAGAVCLFNYPCNSIIIPFQCCTGEEQYNMQTFSTKVSLQIAKRTIHADHLSQQRCSDIQFHVRDTTVSPGLLEAANHHYAADSRRHP